MRKYLFVLLLAGVVCMSHAQEKLADLIAQFKESDDQKRAVVEQKIVAFGEDAVQPLRDFAQQEPNQKWKVNLLLSRIQRQWDGNGHGVFWRENLSAAVAQAQQSEKLVLLLHTTGKFDEQFC